jgi:hypothetical protein
VVGVGVRDDGALDLPPPVDVEVAGRALQALRAAHDQVSGHRRLAAMPGWRKCSARTTPRGRA